MSKHENMPTEEERPEREETFEDLDVPEGQAQDVAGGQKITMTDLIVSS